jgi:hypothetical protein
MPLESGLPDSPSVYQDGLGHEPVTVVGSMRSRVAVYTGLSSRATSAVHRNDYGAAVDDREAELLRAAAARLATLDLYPRPVRTGRVRVVHAPWFFALPGLRRFHGYELGPFILVRAPLEEVTEDLVTHELCHVWQLQHRPFFWLSYLRQGYRDNEFEREARRAVELSRPR